MTSPPGIPAPCIAIRMPNWIGDAVMASPVIEAVKTAWPGARLVLVVKNWAEGLFRNNPLVDAVISLPDKVSRNLVSFLKAVRAIRREKPDIYVCLPGSFSSGLMGWLSGVPVRIGVAGDGRGGLLNLKVSRRPASMHRTDFYLSHIAAIPIPARRGGFKGFPLKLTTSKCLSPRLEKLVRKHGLEHGFVGVNPNAVAESRRWPPDRWVKVLGHLAARKRKTVLFGSRSERAYVEDLNRRAGSAAVVLAGELTLSEMADILRLCRTFVTNDSGPMHMAFALGLRVVGMIGAADDVETGPYNPRRNIMIINKRVPCSPCVLNRCPNKGTDHIVCLTSIGAEEIIRLL